MRKLTIKRYTQKGGTLNNIEYPYYKTLYESISSDPKTFFSETRAFIKEMGKVNTTEQLKKFLLLVMILLVKLQEILKLKDPLPTLENKDINPDITVYTNLQKIKDEMKQLSTQKKDKLSSLYKILNKIVDICTLSKNLPTKHWVGQSVMVYPRKFRENGENKKTTRKSWFGTTTKNSVNGANKKTTRKWTMPKMPTLHFLSKKSVPPTYSI